MSKLINKKEIKRDKGNKMKISIKRIWRERGKWNYWKSKKDKKKNREFLESKSKKNKDRRSKRN